MRSWFYSKITPFISFDIVRTVEWGIAIDRKLIPIPSVVVLLIIIIIIIIIINIIIISVLLFLRSKTIASMSLADFKPLNPGLTKICFNMSLWTISRFKKKEENWGRSMLTPSTNHRIQVSRRSRALDVKEMY